MIYRDSGRCRTLRPLLRPSFPASTIDRRSGQARVLRVLEPFPEDVQDGEGGIESDEVGQLEGSHRVVEAELVGGVDVLLGSSPFVEHPDGFIEEHRERPGRDEPRGCRGTGTTVLPSRSANSFARARPPRGAWRVLG